ncbi:hypothetical protein MBLNU13_g04212t1 [Cladosporium sp. NU13]
MDCDSLRLRGIYSRSLNSARETAALSTKGEVDLCSSESGPGRSLEDLFKRKDISGIIISIPIYSQPGYIEQAIKAGEHVRAEKSLAPNFEAAKKLMETLSSYPLTCSIVENYRFIPKFVFAAQVAKKLGQLDHFSVRAMSFMEADNSCYTTQWRRSLQHQGGPLLDGGVHYVAAARLFLRGDSRVERVMAATYSAQPYLPPLDTVNAVIRTHNGASGMSQLSFDSQLDAFEWDLGFRRGAVNISGDTVTTRLADGEQTVNQFEPASGVREEVADWADGILSSTPNPLQSLREAIADVKFLEMMFRSEERGGSAMECSLQFGSSGVVAD